MVYPKGYPRILETVDKRLWTTSLRREHASQEVPQAAVVASRSQLGQAGVFLMVEARETGWGSWRMRAIKRDNISVPRWGLCVDLLSLLHQRVL
jgi:hypothetical protein